MSQDMKGAKEDDFHTDLEDILRELDSVAPATVGRTHTSAEHPDEFLNRLVRHCGVEEQAPTRWTKDAWSSRKSITSSRNALRHYAKSVVRTSWKTEELPERHPRKKFPFSLYKSDAKENQTNSSNREEEELFPDRVQVASVDYPDPLFLPGWKHLPSSVHRDPRLSELITGLRIASVIHGPRVSLDAWWAIPPGEDACALSLDIWGEDADRFLAGEGGSPGKALHRWVRRPLERFLGDTSIASVWVDVSTPRRKGVRLFLFLRSESLGNANDMEILDRSDRYFKSLRKHGVPLPPDDMPIWINDLADKAAYFGISEEELERRMDLWPTDGDHIGWIDEQEFTPESGFASDTAIEQRARQSRERWRRIAAGHRLPVWFSERFTRCLQEQLSPRTDSKAFRQRMQMRFYLGSPACLAAVATRSGPVLGEYVDARHKRGAAASLYEQIRAGESGHGRPLE